MNQLNGMSEERAELILSNMAFARRLARQFFQQRRTSGIDREDFEAAAMLGLCDAAQRFDLSKGYKFQTYSYFRIRGAMFDLMRRGGGPIQGNWQKPAEAAERSADEADKAGEADEEGVSYAFAATSCELRNLSQVVETLGIRVHSAGDGEVDMTYAWDRDPESECMVNTAREYLRRLIAKLPDRERTIIEMHYFQGHSFDDIRAHFKDISKSWVSRLHTRALENLQELIARENLTAELQPSVAFAEVRA